jgi:hypothetical protein
MQRERLEYLLENWRDWMRHDNNRLGYPTHTLVAVGGGGSCIDAFEIMCDEVDEKQAKQLDALIDSLAPSQKAAVHHKWLSAVYRLRDMEMSYELALDNLMTMADRRGIV